MAHRLDPTTSLECGIEPKPQALRQEAKDVEHRRLTRRVWTHDCSQATWPEFYLAKRTEVGCAHPADTRGPAMLRGGEGHRQLVIVRAFPAGRHDVSISLPQGRADWEHFLRSRSNSGLIAAATKDGRLKLPEPWLTKAT